MRMDLALSCKLSSRLSFRSRCLGRSKWKPSCLQQTFTKHLLKFLLNLTSNKSSCLQQNIFWNFYSICRKGVILRKACILFQITWCHVDFCMVIIHIFTCTAPYRQLHQRLSHCWLSSAGWQEGWNLASSKSRWPSLRCSIWAAAFLTPLHYQYMIIQIHFPHNLYHLTWVYCRLFHCDTAPEPPPSPSDKKAMISQD